MISFGLFAQAFCMSFHVKNTGWHPRSHLLQQYNTRRETLSFGAQVWVNVRILLATPTSNTVTQPVNVSCSINHRLKAPWMTWACWETDALFSCRMLRTDLILWAQTCRSNTTSPSSWLLAALHLLPLSATHKSVTCRLIPVSLP